MKIGLTLLCLSSALLFGCSNNAAVVSGCDTTPSMVPAMTPFCLFSNPEDIEALPDQRTLLISQMGKNMEDATPGSLVFFDTTTATVSPAFPTSTSATASAPSSATPPTENWGSAQCPGDPGASLAPHGISLRQRNDQRWQIAVVNHGGRESIEMFELLPRAAGDAAPRLQWRGCVVPPAGSFLNDVVLLKNGGFIASHMFDKRSPQVLGSSLGVIKAIIGMDTGYVLEWQPDDHYRILEGSHGPFLNGVELSADETTVFANVYFGQQVRKIDRKSGQQIAAISVSGHPDNLAWDSKGRLLVATHTSSLGELMACSKHPGETCTLAYAIERIDPETMSKDTVLQHAGAPMGAATVARELNGQLYLGSFTGNRIVRSEYR